jgi:hypothetical protein
MPRASVGRAGPNRPTWRRTTGPSAAGIDIADIQDADVHLMDRLTLRRAAD